MYGEYGERDTQALPLEHGEEWDGSLSFGKIRIIRTEQWEDSAFGYGLVGRNTDHVCSCEGALYKKLVGVLFKEIRKLRREVTKLKKELKNG